MATPTSRQADGVALDVVVADSRDDQAPAGRSARREVDFCVRSVFSKSPGWPLTL